MTYTTCELKECKSRCPNYIIIGLMVAAIVWVPQVIDPASDYLAGDGEIRVIQSVKGDLNPLLVKVREEFDKIESKDDKLVIYKLFAGAGDYLSTAEFKGSTSQLDPLLGKVQTSYNWKREKYPEFTDAVSAYLDEVDYDEPKNIDTPAERAAFAQIFKDLAEALK